MYKAEASASRAYQAYLAKEGEERRGERLPRRTRKPVPTVRGKTAPKGKPRVRKPRG